jgi:hypothetical protein
MVNLTWGHTERVPKLILIITAIIINTVVYTSFAPDRHGDYIVYSSF